MKNLHYYFMPGDLIRTFMDPRGSSFGLFICQVTADDENRYNDLCLVLVKGIVREMYNSDWRHV